MIDAHTEGGSVVRLVGSPYIGTVRTTTQPLPPMDGVFVDMDAAWGDCVAFIRCDCLELVSPPPAVAT